MTLEQVSLAGLLAGVVDGGAGHIGVALAGAPGEHADADGVLLVHLALPVGGRAQVLILRGGHLGDLVGGHVAGGGHVDVVIGHGGLQLAGPLVGDLLGVLVQDAVLIEVLHRLVDRHTRVGEGLDQVHRVGVARLVVAAGVGIGGVGGQTEEGHGGVGGQRQHIVVILHDDGALFALPDGDVPGGGLHLVDGGVVALEAGGILIGNGDIAAGSKEAVQR